MNKKILSIVLMLIVALVGVLSGCTNIKDKGDAPSSNISSSDELTIMEQCVIMVSDETVVKNAKCIVTGKVVDVEVKNIIDSYTDQEDDEQSREIYSFYTIQIEKKLKGVPDDVDKVTAIEIGDGKTVATLLTEESGGYMKNGDNVLLFLEEMEDSNKSIYEELNKEKADFYMISAQGRIWLDENGDFDKAKESFNSQKLKTIKSVEDVEEILKTLE